MSHCLVYYAWHEVARREAVHHNANALRVWPHGHAEWIGPSTDRHLPHRAAKAGLAADALAVFRGNLWHAMTHQTMALEGTHCDFVFLDADRLRKSSDQRLLSLQAQSPPFCPHLLAVLAAPKPLPLSHFRRKVFFSFPPYYCACCSTPLPLSHFRRKVFLSVSSLLLCLLLLHVSRCPAAVSITTSLQQTVMETVYSRLSPYNHLFARSTAPLPLSRICMVSILIGCGRTASVLSALAAASTSRNSWR